MKGVTKTVENEVKEQKGELLDMIVPTLGTNLLGNMLARRRVIRAGVETIRVGEGWIRAG